MNIPLPGFLRRSGPAPHAGLKAPRRRARRVGDLERLEDRTLLTGVNYHNGIPLLSSVKVDAVFYGSAWTTNSSLASYRQYLVNFLAMVTNSTFMDGLSQYDAAPYHLGRGSLSGNFVVNAASPSTLTDSQIQKTLAANFPGTNNHLLLVFTPPGTVVSLAGQDGNGNTHWYSSATDFYGYHQAFINPANFNQWIYGVVAFPGGPNPPAPGLSAQDGLTATASHELVEAVTDANPLTKGGGLGGWYTEPNTVITTGGGATVPVPYQEIADLTKIPDGNGGWLLNGGYATLGGYTIQKYYSNASGGGYLPAGAVDRNVPSPTGGGGSSGSDDPSVSDIQRPAAADLSSLNLPLNVDTGQPFNGPVGTIRDAVGSNPQVTIDWGDNTSQALTVSSIGSSEYNVSGSHTYAKGGTYTYTLTITDAGKTQSSTGKATVTDPLFRQSTGVPVNGLNAAGSASGDFNGDGRLDMVVRGADDSLTLAMNTAAGFGTASFQTAALPELFANGAVGVAVGDYAGDANADLLTMYSFGFSVRQGRGDGTFGPELYTSLGAHAITALTTGDFNRDGHPDVAYTYVQSAPNGAGAGVLLGNGDGTFQPEVVYATDASPFGIVAADLTGSGVLDLVTGDGAVSQLGVLRGKGDGTFAPAVFYGAGGPVPYRLTAGDLSGHGRADIVFPSHYVGAQTSQQVMVMTSNADGTLNPPVGYDSAGVVGSVAVADLTGDGKADVVVAGDSAAPGLAVLPGLGEGALDAAVTFPVTGAGEPLAVGDFTRGGAPGVVVNVGNVLTVLPSSRQTLPAAAPPTLTPVGPVVAVVGRQVSVQVKAVAPDTRETVKYSLLNAPPGATIDPKTGVFTWTPAAGPAAVTVTVQAADDGPAPNAASESFVLNVRLTPPPTTSVNFVVGSDDHVYARTLDGSGNPTFGYYQAAYGQVADLAATRLNGPANFETFVVGVDGQVYAETIAGATRSGYFPTAYGSVSSVAAGADAAGNPLLFAVGTDDQLYEQKFDAAGRPTSSSYTRAAYGDFRSALATHDAANNPLLYAVGQDGQVYGLKMNSAGAPTGGLFKVGNGQVKQLAVGHDAANVPEIFVVGTDDGGNLHKLDASGSPVGPYVGFGGPVTAVSATNDAANNPELFVIGGDGQVYGHKFDAAGNPTGGFFRAATASGSVSAISAGVDPNGNPELFAVLASNGQVYAAPFDASGDPAGPYSWSAPGKVKKLVVA